MTTAGLMPWRCISSQARLNPSDIVQEGMLAAHRDFEGFRGTSQGELLCWLRTILIHVLQQNYEKHIKAAKRDIRRERSLNYMEVRSDQSHPGLAAALTANTPSPIAVLQAQESDDRLAKQLARLKPDQNEVCTPMTCLLRARLSRHPRGRVKPRHTNM